MPPHLLATSRAVSLHALGQYEIADDMNAKVLLELVIHEMCH